MAKFHQEAAEKAIGQGVERVEEKRNLRFLGRSRWSALGADLQQPLQVVRAKGAGGRPVRADCTSANWVKRRALPGKRLISGNSARVAASASPDLSAAFAAFSAASTAVLIRNMPV